MEPTLVSAQEALGLRELFSAAESALAQGKTEEARRRFEQAWLTVSSAPPGALPPDLEHARERARFGLATADDLLGRNEEALSGYLGVAEEPSSFQKVARVRAIRLLVHLERYGQAQKLAAGFEPEELTSLDELAVRGAQAVTLMMVDEVPSEEQLEQAVHAVGVARELIEKEGFDRVVTPPIEVAVVFFALGEVERARARGIRFDPNSDDFTERLERRCRHLLDAQAAYSEVMRSKNAHWSGMAGVRVGELYFELHRDLMQMGPPQAASSSDQKLLYWGAIRLRYGILLRKAVRMLERTEEMLQRTQEPTRFRELCAQELARLREAQEKEEAALDQLPYSRDQLRAVLRDLSLQHGGSGQI
jgi:tetratricopeptide (TPR) repeat protein